MKGTHWLAIVVVLATSSCSGLPSDEELIKRYSEQKAIFNSFAELLLNQLQANDVLSIDPAGPGEEQDWPDDYYLTLRSLKVRSVGRLAEGPCALFFVVANNIVVTRQKGYAYCSEMPSPRFESLTREPTGLPHATTGYRMIDDHWFIFYWWT